MSQTRSQREELFLLWKSWDKAKNGPLFPPDSTVSQRQVPPHLLRSYRFLWYSFDGLSLELGERLKKGWSKTPRDWRRVLLLAATEWLWDSGEHAYATLSEWGEICRAHCGESAVKVVNGTLRAFLRGHESPSELTVLKFLPLELIQYWSCSGLPEGDLVSALKSSRVQFFYPLGEFNSELVEKVESSCLDVYSLKHGVEPKLLLENTSGFFQNIHAAELVRKVLDLKVDGSVLDYCSAPGGKSWQMARFNEGKGGIYLHDVNKRRARRIKESPLLEYFDRCEWVDMERLESEEYDNILIDVPCGNSGVLVKSPEATKHLWYQNDECAEVQNEVLQKALGFLREGGRLFYSTCSINPSENEYRVKHFCEEMSMQLVSEFQWWPDSRGGHGAYLACMEW